MWGWTFKKLEDKPTVSGFERIGITDRAILSRIGTILIFCLIIYVLWAVVSALLNYYKSVRGVSTIISWIGLENSHTIGFLFAYIVYMQVFVGSLINWDNARLINSPSNFGANGNLDFDDQFNIVIGFIFFGLCLLFPVIVWYVMDLNFKKLMMKTKDRVYYYKSFLFLNEELRDNIEPWYNYFFVVVIRRAAFCLSAYYLGSNEFSTLQVMLNMVFSVLFSCYLLQTKLFKEDFMHYMQVFNELLILLVSYHQIWYTDYVVEPIFKYRAGSSMVAICFIYLMVPNLFLIVREWFISLTIWLKKMGYIHVKEFQYIKHCELKRREFLNGHRNNIVAKKKMQL